jgi:peptidoglycan hydrolase-like protein with peptidoglycan-binding domain
MTVTCLACATGGGCSEPKLAEDANAVVIRASVGAGGVNQPVDVRSIQSALNDIPSEDGGADPLLAVDGIAGPLTRAAIAQFQRAHVRVADSRVDPKGRTLAALNTELDSGGADVVTAPGGSAGRRGRPPRLQTPDPAVVTKIVELLPKVRAVIRAANFHILTANPFVTRTKIQAPTGLFQANVRFSLNLLDKGFDLGKFANPRPAFDNIKTAFRNMDVALNRSFETAPLIAPILFVPNTHVVMESQASAYTSKGGAFLTAKSRLKGLDEPADRIYLCNRLLAETETDQISVAVHELAHFVSGRPILIDDIVKTGRMLNASEKPRYDALRPEQKIRSAEHYAFFALLAGVRRL